MAGYEIGPNLRSGVRPWPSDWERSVVVKVCDHPKWETVLLMPGPGCLGDEVVRCVQCHAPRCGSVRDEDPCMRQRHHRIHHTFLSGKILPVGDTQCELAGCECVAKRTRELARRK